MRVGSKIKKLREFRNLTQEYVAKQLQMTQQSYSKLEKNETDITLTRLGQIAKVLGVGESDILNFDEKVIFSQNNNNSFGVNYYHSHIQEIQKLYESRIEDMQNEINYLRSLVERSFVK